MCIDRQTADNFLAAATFLELCKISPNVDPEVGLKAPTVYLKLTTNKIQTDPVENKILEISGISDN